MIYNYVNKHSMKKAIVQPPSWDSLRLLHLMTPWLNLVETKHKVASRYNESSNHNRTLFMDSIALEYSRNEMNILCE